MSATARSRSEELTEALEAVRSALLTDAENEADRLRSEATAAGDELVADARSRVDSEVDRARHRAAQRARARTERELATARAAIHGRVLRAQAAIRRELADAIRESAAGLRDDPRYPALLDALEREAQRRLGPDAVVDRDVHDLGGVVAVAGRRRIDLTLPALAARALDAMADEVVATWS